MNARARVSRIHKEIRRYHRPSPSAFLALFLLHAPRRPSRARSHRARRSRAPRRRDSASSTASTLAVSVHRVRSIPRARPRERETARDSTDLDARSIPARVGVYARRATIPPRARDRRRGALPPVRFRRLLVLVLRVFRVIRPYLSPILGIRSHEDYDGRRRGGGTTGD